MPGISEAEAQVMEVLWANSPPGQLCTEDIAAALQGHQGWQLATIKTLLNRLLKKGAITAQKDGRRYLYSALLQRSAWVDEQACGLLDRLFGGSLAPLVAQFTSQRKLKPADVAAIQQLLKDYERG
jgi:predicted transcriptional regulator